MCRVFVTMAPALLRFWFQTYLRHKNSASYLKTQAGRPFVTMVTHWSRSTSNFYALTGQNLTGEFMRKIYAAPWNLQSFESTCDVFFNCLFPLNVHNEIQLLSRVFFYSWLICLLGFRLRNAVSWNLFTLTAEADRVFCQLVMCFTVFSHWMHKKKYSCYQHSSVIHGWFVYWIFGWETRRLSKSEIRFRMTSFSFFNLLDGGWKVPQAILILDSFQELHLEW